MALHLFCPFSSCAAKVPYDTIKPTTCPRCNRAFADAFRTVTPTPPKEVPVDPAYEPEDDRPLGRAALARRGVPTSRPAARPAREAQSNIMNAPPELDAPVGDDGADEDGFGDENVNPREVRRRARELAASIDPSTIIIADQDEGVFKFKDMWDEGAEARAKAAKKGTTKRKGRR